MIVSQAELRVMLGVASSITDEERAVLTLVHQQAENLICRELGYDPEQRQATEYYPRREPAGGPSETVWDSNGQNAYMQSIRMAGGKRLQLERLPVRKIVEVIEDQDGRFGQQTGAFDTNGTTLIEGTDYWLEVEEDNFSASGLLIRTGTWPQEQGTVRVKYVAGYSKLELAGFSKRLNASTTSDTNGQYTNVGRDASGIARAVILTVNKAMMTWAQNRKKTTAGWTAGQLNSEKLGDYSYTTGGGSVNTAGLVTALPAEAREELAPFVHYGIQVI